MSLQTWYAEELEKIENHKDDSIKVLNALMTYKRSECKHNLVRVAGLFYAVGETCDGMRCTECGYARHLTREERYPPEPKKKFKFWNLS